MARLSSMFLNSLAITPEGNCARHPHVSIFSNEEEISSSVSASLRGCECCWKDQQERKEQSVGDLTTTSISLLSGSDHNADGVSPPSPAAKKLPLASGSAISIANSNAWVDSVNIRWSQVQELSRGSSRKPMDDFSGRSNPESWENGLLNMSMAAVSEEPEDRTSHTADTQTINTNSLAPTPMQWSRLEDQVQRQDASIRKLQETVEHQEATIRQDLEHLIQLVTTVASNQQHLQQLLPSEPDDAATPTPGIVRVPNGISARTPVVSNAGGHNQRPTLYSKNLQHPANIFTSVRTIERRPPKPPMRHNSFSTQTRGSLRRGASVDSSKISEAILSSLGNSTGNDATSYNDTTTHNDTTTPSISQRDLSIDENDIAWGAGFGPGIESMLERERSKPLDIIFDASAAISTDFLLEETNIHNQNKSGEEDKEDEEKKTGSPASGSTASSKKSQLPDGEERQKAPSRDSFQKTAGSMRLSIPSDLSEVDDDIQSKTIESKPAASPLYNSAPELPPAPLTDEPLSNGRFVTRPASGPRPPLTDTAQDLQARQPRREPSAINVTTGTTQRVAPNSKPRPPSRSRNCTHPNKFSRFVPPPPPPATGTARSLVGRLDMRNLSKLGKSTAPPRREIFATGTSKMQISCLTIDTSILSENEPSKPPYESANPGVYREVTNYDLTDKFGDRGVYTGSLREDRSADNIDKEQEEKQEEKQGWESQLDESGKKTGGIAHGGGTMKYEGGRFYRGEWRDGHWHGNGLLRNSNGDSYEGDFIYDARHGRGIYKYENGDVYEGDFTEDKRHGKGTFMFHNGSVYRGDFVNGDFEGYGWYEFADGYYEGEWVGGAYQGIGTLQYMDGGSYTGRFVEGKAHGLGEEKDADGTLRRGEWNKGELTECQ